MSMDRYVLLIISENLFAIQLPYINDCVITSCVVFLGAD